MELVCKFINSINCLWHEEKVAQTHIRRLLTIELGNDIIGVNTFNPDAVIQGSNIWEGGWTEGRAKAYGILF